MLGVLLPIGDSCLVSKVGNRNSEPAGSSRVFRAETTWVLHGKLEHCARHGVITVVTIRALGSEYYGVVGWFWSNGETFDHSYPRFQPATRAQARFEKSLYTQPLHCGTQGGGRSGAPAAV